jgi:hypothetical protein
MNTAVQKKQKIAATVYLNPNDEGREYMKNQPNDVASMPYGRTIYVYNKGCLSDYFDFEGIKKFYGKHRIKRIEWNVVKEFFEKPLSFFGDENKCGFSIQCGGNCEQSIILGLLLGYPIESTMAWIMRNNDYGLKLHHN